MNELALLRRLIGVAGDIAEMGYDHPDDVTETLDRAEAREFEVAERRVSDSMTGIRDALQDTLDNLEARYGQDSDLVGVPTGFTEIDNILHGLQASTLTILAARPGMGKTSLALGMARNVATQTGRPVVFFGSMEMGTLELTERLLSDGGRVDATRLWTAKSERARLGKDQPPGRKVGRGPAPHRRQPALHGDGDAGQVPPVAEARFGDLALVVVDRIQLLMTPSGPGSAIREPPGRGVRDLPWPQDPRLASWSAR